MAVTATLVYAGHNFLRYLIAQNGAAGTTATITCTGAASPDLITDSLAGPLKNIAKVVAQGYKQFPAGVQSQGRTRGLWLSNLVAAEATAPLGVSFLRTNPTARCDLAPRDNFLITVDANVDGGGNPTLVVTTQAAAGQAYLDVRVPNTIGA